MTAIQIDILSPPPRKAKKPETKYRFYSHPLTVLCPPPKLTPTRPTTTTTNRISPITDTIPLSPTGSNSIIRSRLESYPNRSFDAATSKRRRRIDRLRYQPSTGNNLTETRQEPTVTDPECLEKEETMPSQPLTPGSDKIAPSSTKVSIKGARTASVPLKFKVQYRSHSPTSSMMDIDSTNDDQTTASSTCDNSSVRRSCVHFDTSVTVTEIPNRDAYTIEQKNQMWNNSASIRYMAQRNSYEYNWEGRNWRCAMEEESFFQYYGNLIHPAHYQAVCKSMRHHEHGRVSPSPSPICSKAKQQAASILSEP